MQARATKQKIFDIAHKMFQEKGFNNVTVEEIATAADLSIGTLYHHFKNKFELLVSWHDHVDDLYMAYYKKIKTSPEYIGQGILPLLKEELLYMNETCIYYGADYITTVYIYQLTNHDFATIMSDRKRPYYTIMTELILEGQKSGEIRNDIPATKLVNDITMVSRGILTDWVIRGATDDIRSHSISLVDTYLNGITVK